MPPILLIYFRPSYGYRNRANNITDMGIPSLSLLGDSFLKFVRIMHGDSFLKFVRRMHGVLVRLMHTTFFLRKVNRPLTKLAE